MQSGEAGPGVASKTGVDRRSFGTGHVGDIGRVATTQTTRTSARNPSRSNGEQPHTCGVGLTHVLGVFGQRSFRKFSRPRRVHVRNAESVLGGRGDSTSPPSCRRRFGTRRSTSDRHQKIHDVNHDGVTEERRRRERNRHRHFISPARRSDTRSPIQQRSGGSVCSLSVRPLDQRRTDCVGHAIRALTDADPECTILSIDGVGAYDHIFRSSFLAKLHQVPGLWGLLPFVRSIYAQPTTYVWTDDSGAQHRIRQAEGGEQGDPLIPLLFSLGIHDSLCAVSEQLRPEDKLFAYLDDVHVVSPTVRIRGAYNLLEEQLSVGAGIQLHTGKTRVWNLDVADLGDEVWNPAGIKILGTPIGTSEFVRSITQQRLEDEGRLWEAIAWVPDLQCAWQILLQCAGPRCHHLLRTLPPSQATEYAQAHDDGMLQVMNALMGGLTGTEQERTTAHQLATLPMRLGGLGLRSASRMAPASFWSSWADALQMIHQRLPEVADTIVESLEGPREVGGCIGELRAVTAALDQQGFIGRPTWTDLKAGARPPPANLTEPGEWAHGWQFYASSVSEHHFRKTVVLAQSCPSHQAHLRSHSGGGSSNVLHGCPTTPEFAVEPELFRNLILERLRLPLAVADATCECGTPLDSRGRHRAACPLSGRLRTRAVAPERTRVCREAGAIVRTNVKLRDMNIAVRADDERCIEVVASGLPLFHGAQLAVDITLRCALTSRGEPRTGAAREDGIACQSARADKAQKYAELLAGDRCRLVVVALETGGRWSTEALEFVECLARCRSREAAPTLARSAFLAWRRRWSRMLSISCARAFAISLTAGPRTLHAVANTDGGTPDAVDLFSEK